MKQPQQAAPGSFGRVGRAVSIAIFAAAVALALYIMANGMGLVESLDFGAGAYYYADIPGFERFVNGEAYQSPVSMGTLIALFLAWGWLMYRLWMRIDRLGKPAQTEQKPKGTEVE